jgi:chaperone modulatory protein CbpM
MTEYENSLIEGHVIDDNTEITIVQLCRRCSVESDLVERLVAEGIIEPTRQEGEMLYFPQSCTRRTRIVMRLRSDLGVNMAGAALALELLERIEKLQSRLRMP